MTPDDYVARALRLRVIHLRKLLSVVMKNLEWREQRKQEWQNEIDAIEMYMRRREMPLAS